jgi:ribosomal protein S12
MTDKEKDGARKFLAVMWPRTLPALEKHPHAEHVIVDIMVAFAKQSALRKVAEDQS